MSYTKVEFAILLRVFSAADVAPFILSVLSNVEILSRPWVTCPVMVESYNLETSRGLIDPWVMVPRGEALGASK